AFDGANPGALDLHRQREARARRHTIDLYGAGAADAVLAADMGAGHSEPVAQEIGQQHARLGFGFNDPAVELEPYAMAPVGAQARQRRASWMAARPSGGKRLRG